MTTRLLTTFYLLAFSLHAAADFSLPNGYTDGRPEIIPFTMKYFSFVRASTGATIQSLQIVTYDVTPHSYPAALGAWFYQVSSEGGSVLCLNPDEWEFTQTTGKWVKLPLAVTLDGGVSTPGHGAHAVCVKSRDAKAFGHLTISAPEGVPSAGKYRVRGYVTAYTD